MASLNKVFLLGNLTRDPELRQLPSGTALCSFALAVNRSFTTTGGEPREEVCFVEMVAMGRQGETIAQYMRKGSLLFVEGRLRFEQWEDRETNKRRSRLSVHVERAQFMGPPAAQQPPAASYYQPQSQPPTGYPAPAAPGAYYQPQPPQPPPTGYGAPPAIPKAPPAMPSFNPLPEQPPAASAAGGRNDQGEADIAEDAVPLDDIPF